MESTTTDHTKIQEAAVDHMTRLIDAGILPSDASVGMEHGLNNGGDPNKIADVSLDLELEWIEGYAFEVKTEPSTRQRRDAIRKLATYHRLRYQPVLVAPRKFISDKKHVYLDVGNFSFRDLLRWMGVSVIEARVVSGDLDGEAEVHFEPLKFFCDKELEQMFGETAFLEPIEFIRDSESDSRE
jgi:hypothetical protein